MTFPNDCPNDCPNDFSERVYTRVLPIVRAHPRTVELIIRTRVDLMMVVCLQTTSNIYVRVAGCVTRPTHTKRPSRLVQHVLFRLRGWSPCPTHGTAPSTRPTHYKLVSWLVSFHILHALRTMEFPCPSHELRVLTLGILVTGL